ncbi:polysaccharide deacetylase family protein [Paenibacillus dakarensis]|uniref:polysaccharide deacetylase family protein n=1 Tax=Paenibacillus dakarensis TaxID=1527293 RepID=UPI0006D56241|nr:polysaccharide deacetylase family protein [Paenibacillus dakarensis]
MVIRTSALFLAASLVLSACGQAEKNSPAPSGAESENNTAPNETNQAPSSDKENKDSSDALDPSDTSNKTSTEPERSEDTGKEKDNSDNTQAEETPAAPQYYMNKVYNIVPNDEAAEKKIVLLTFDDGPKDEKMINGLIDTLDKHKAKAIFFVNGYRVKQNPELLKLIHERGQIIGNHSWDHIDLKKESKATAKKQIEDVQKIVMDTIGEKPKFFRPPFGSGGDYVKQVVSENNMLFMTWSNGSLDWESQSRNNPEAVINNVMEQLHPGSNILMHELPWTVEALDTLLTKLEKKGYSFVDPQNIELKTK